jgi:hypothetical protein
MVLPIISEAAGGGGANKKPSTPIKDYEEKIDELFEKTFELFEKELTFFSWAYPVRKFSVFYNRTGMFVFIIPLK